MKNKLRRALLDRELSFGTWVQIGHPASGEVLALAGFDWVCVDLEHGVIDLETATNIFRALDAHGCVPVARIPANDPVWIHRILDAGALGLIVPMINSYDEGLRAVGEALYPPDGVRGFGYGRANRHGIEFDRYIAHANSEIALILQIEHKEAISNLDTIAGIERVDGLFVGPLDLSGSMGVTGQLDHPLMKKALSKFVKTCQRFEKAAGMHVLGLDAKSISEAVGNGYSLISLGLDNAFMYEGARRAVEAAHLAKQDREANG